MRHRLCVFELEQQLYGDGADFEVVVLDVVDDALEVWPSLVKRGCFNGFDECLCANRPTATAPIYAVLWL